MRSKTSQTTLQTLLVISYLIMAKLLLNISIIIMLRLDKIILNNDTYKLVVASHSKHRDLMKDIIL